MKKYFSLSVLVLVISSFSFSQTRAERKQAKKEQIEAEYISTKELINYKILTSSEKDYLLKYHIEVYSKISMYLNLKERKWLASFI